MCRMVAREEICRHLHLICVDMLIRRKQLLLDHQLAYTEMDSAEADGADILVN